ncbi:MAG: thiamine diphosphokinase [Actinobacteria bacterium]|nr:thiamine diphosphokinase [Actinomycetota bacterium]
MGERRPADAALVLGGGTLHEAAVAAASGAAVVVAADSGVDHALAAGLAVHHVVGDLDSATAASLATADAAGAAIHPHPADKDATDSELALDLILSLLDRPGPPGRRRLVVVGGGAERLDHLLADVAQLTGPALEPVEVTAVLGAATCTVVRAGRPRELTGVAGEQVSLLTPAGAARGVTTSGLRWSLADAALGAGTTRGVSNELLGAAATVSCAQGVVLVVQPGTAAPAVAPRTGAYDPSPRPPTGS